MSKKKSKRGGSVNNQVVSLIGTKLPCGACEDCLNAAFDAAADAVRNGPFNDFSARYEHLIAVALAFAKKNGTDTALAVLACAFERWTTEDMSVCLGMAANVLGIEINVKKGWVSEAGELVFEEEAA